MLNPIDTRFSNHSEFLRRMYISEPYFFPNFYQGSDDSDFKYRGGVSPTLNYTGWLFDTNSWSQMVYERYLPLLPHAPPPSSVQKLSSFKDSWRICNVSLPCFCFVSTREFVNQNVSLK